MSQYELALQARTFQANISSIENGKTDPSLGTIDACLAPLGYSLMLVPTRLASASAIAIEVQKELSRNRFDNAFRNVIQLSDNLRSASKETLIALTLSQPPTTSDIKFDALMAGICEHYLSNKDLHVPDWINGDRFALTSEWIVDRFEKNASLLRKVTPVAILKHGVLLSQDELMSV